MAYWLGMGRNDPGVERLGRIDGWRRAVLRVIAWVTLLFMVAAVVGTLLNVVRS